VTSASAITFSLINHRPSHRLAQAHELRFPPFRKRGQGFELLKEIIDPLLHVHFVHSEKSSLSSSTYVHSGAQGVPCWDRCRVAQPSVGDDTGVDSGSLSGPC
jgi:hypothetical protein